jgi:hypothetical protein
VHGNRRPKVAETSTQMTCSACRGDDPPLMDEEIEELLRIAPCSSSLLILASRYGAI